MWSKFIPITLALLYSSVAIAEQPQFTFLDENQRAPFAGTLFNPSATAELIVLPEHLRAEFDIEFLRALETNDESTKSSIITQKTNLRDLPSTSLPQLDSDGQLSNVTWPTKPE